MTELTINAAAFKARCLDLMDQLASHKLSRVTITKHGKPVSVMEAAVAKKPKRSIIGCMVDHMAQEAVDWDAVEREAAALSAAWPDAAEMERQMKERLSS